MLTPYEHSLYLYHDEKLFHDSQPLWVYHYFNVKEIRIRDQVQARPLKSNIPWCDMSLVCWTATSPAAAFEYYTCTYNKLLCISCFMSSFYVSSTYFLVPNLKIVNDINTLSYDGLFMCFGTVIH
jgi:hypothetical protein